jgi:hypothetical protein
MTDEPACTRTDCGYNRKIKPICDYVMYRHVRCPCRSGDKCAVFTARNIPVRVNLPDIDYGSGRIMWDKKTASKR